MSQRTIMGTPELSRAIRRRRQSLGLTIQEAASRAGVGIKTWCRYESGASIRKDKAKGICKALNWHMLPDETAESDGVFCIDKYKTRKEWSQFICDRYGEDAALSFVVGSDILLDYLEEDLVELSVLPKGTHVGQLAASMTKDILPPQFLTRYDYEFIYCLRATVVKLRDIAQDGTPFFARSVIQELAIYLFAETSEFLMDCMLSDTNTYRADGADAWRDWIFDFFEDMDIVTHLYSGTYLTADYAYHFDHWTEEQFDL